MAARAIERALGYRFRDSALLETALRHRSAGSEHNERLEFLGDAILGMVVADHLFRRFADASEGQLTRMRAHLVRGPTLAAVARDLGLGEHLELGGGALNSGDHDRDSVLADALEALLGAVYLDGGMPEATALVERLLESRLETADPSIVYKDPKTRLQEFLQRRGLALPEYRVVAESGQSHARRFSVELDVPGRDAPFHGEGTSRRRAEQAAASNALEFLTLSLSRAGTAHERHPD